MLWGICSHFQKRIIPQASFLWVHYYQTWKISCMSWFHLFREHFLPVAMWLCPDSELSSLEMKIRLIFLVSRLSSVPAPRIFHLWKCSWTRGHCYVQAVCLDSLDSLLLVSWGPCILVVWDNVITNNRAIAPAKESSRKPQRYAVMCGL